MFAVNPDTAESDLAQVDRQELQDRVWRGVRFLWGTVPPGSAAAAGSIPPIHQLQVDLLWGVLALLLLETALGWALGVKGL